MKKVALISGITGQDGSFLAEFLLSKGYEVHGIMRRSSSFNTGRIEHLYLEEWVKDMKNPRRFFHIGNFIADAVQCRINARVDGFIILDSHNTETSAR